VSEFLAPCGAFVQEAACPDDCLLCFSIVLDAWRVQSHAVYFCVLQSRIDSREADSICSCMVQCLKFLDHGEQTHCLGLICSVASAVSIVPCFSV